MFGRKDDWYERSDDMSDLDEKSGSVWSIGLFEVVKFFGFAVFVCLIIFMLYQAFQVEPVVVNDVQRSVVGVQIFDEYQRNEYLTFVSVNGTLVPIRHDAVYKITFDYDGMKFVVDDEKVYAKYYDDIGRFIDATLEVSSLSDGTTKYQIVELEPDVKGGDSIE